MHVYNLNNKMYGNQEVGENIILGTRSISKFFRMRHDEEKF
jgi:hypothetical protein